MLVSCLPALQLFQHKRHLDTPPLTHAPWPHVPLPQIFGWNIGTGQAVVEISCHTDTIYSLAFNYDGSKFVTTSKDKKIRVIDARTGAVDQETDGHKGAKSSRAIFTGSSGKIFSTGFSRMNERQFGVWNPVGCGRQSETGMELTRGWMQEDMSKALKMEMIDTSSGTLFPYYDDDTQMVYVAGKVSSCLAIANSSCAPRILSLVDTPSS